MATSLFESSALVIYFKYWVMVKDTDCLLQLLELHRSNHSFVMYKLNIIRMYTQASTPTLGLYNFLTVLVPGSQPSPAQWAAGD